MDYAKHSDEQGRIKDVDEFIADQQAERRPKPARPCAKDVYTDRTHDIAALLDWIGLEVKQHAEYAEKEGLNWAHAGDAGHLRRLLVEALAFLAERDEKDIEDALADAAAGREQNER